MTKDNAFNLATRAIKKPSLLDELTEDTYVKFVIGVALYHKDLAVKLDEIRSIGEPQNKILFWEAIGVLTTPEDFN
jgi:hypothetical protein|tara:strand:+ start:285 stop:512 length:228 start_codon:yes stop_codon:yes gene_type:complete